MSDIEKYGTIGGMEYISDVLKDRNIILGTNDPVVADGFM